MCHTLPADEYPTRCAQIRTGCASRCQQLWGSNLLQSYAPHTQPLCDYFDQSSIEFVPDVSRPAHIKFIQSLRMSPQLNFIATVIVTLSHRAQPTLRRAWKFKTSSPAPSNTILWARSGALQRQTTFGRKYVGSCGNTTCRPIAYR